MYQLIMSKSPSSGYSPRLLYLLPVIGRLSKSRRENIVNKLYNNNPKRVIPGVEGALLCGTTPRYLPVSQKICLIKDRAWQDVHRHWDYNRSYHPWWRPLNTFTILSQHKTLVIAMILASVQVWVRGNEISKSQDMARDLFRSFRQP